MNGTPDSKPIKITKISYTVPVSCCVAQTCGPGDHPAAPELPWRRRIRLRMGSWWYDNRPRIHRGPCDLDDCW